MEIIAGILVALQAYLLGSLNFAIIVVRLTKGEDIRKFGSGNAGTTNVLRTYGKKYAAAVLLGDLLKGITAVLIGMLAAYLLQFDGRIAQYLAALFAVMGHIFPIYFRFKGGKGVATTAGVLVMLSPLAFLFVFATFAVVIKFSKMVSLASIISAVTIPLFMGAAAFLSNGDAALEAMLSMILSVLVIYMHRGNIHRLKNGTERKLGKKKNE